MTDSVATAEGAVDVSSRVDGVLRRLRKLPEARSILLRRRFRAVRYAFYDDLWRRSAANLGADAAATGDGRYRITRGGVQVFVGAKDVRLDGDMETVLANKSHTHKLMLEAGLKVPRHRVFTLEDLGAAEAFFAEVGGKVVVKPADGTGAGRGVTTEISTLPAFRRAAAYAGRYNPLIIAEEQVPGASHRLLFLDGEFVDCIRKDPPVVSGDGRSTVRALVAKENARRFGERPITALNPLVIDGDARNTLAAAGLTPASRPGAGQKVVVKKASNENAAADSHCLAGDVHPDILAETTSFVRAQGVRFCGIDVMTTDIGRPVAETGGAYLEINTPPGIHHHYLVSDRSKAIPVAEILLTRLLDNAAEAVD